MVMVRVIEANDSIEFKGWVKLGEGLTWETVGSGERQSGGLVGEQDPVPECARMGAGGPVHWD